MFAPSRESDPVPDRHETPAASNGGITAAARAGSAALDPLLRVAEIAGGIAAAEELGGTNYAGPIELPMAKLAVLGDPQGAMFAIYAGQYETLGRSRCPRCARATDQPQRLARALGQSQPSGAARPIMCPALMPSPQRPEGTPLRAPRRRVRGDPGETNDADRTDRDALLARRVADDDRGAARSPRCLGSRSAAG